MFQLFPEYPQATYIIIHQQIDFAAVLCSAVFVIFLCQILHKVVSFAKLAYVKTCYDKSFDFYFNKSKIDGNKFGKRRKVSVI